MKQKAFFIIFKGLSLKEVKQSGFKKNIDKTMFIIRKFEIYSGNCLFHHAFVLFRITSYTQCKNSYSQKFLEQFFRAKS